VKIKKGEIEEEPMRYKEFIDVRMQNVKKVMGKNY
jgi:hypothetical protein